MPLTPAEVHNVAFKKPPLGKRGYDEEEVDAFLDTVEVELSRLIEENNELRAGMASDESAAAPTTGTTDGSAEELAGPREEANRLQARVSELEGVLAQDENGAQQQLVQLQERLAQTESQLAENRRQLAEVTGGDATNQRVDLSKDAPNGSSTPAMAPEHRQAVQVLALAQQTADQHLAQSKAEAERLLAEAQSTAEAKVSDAHQKSTEQLADADARAKQLHEQSSAQAAQAIQEAEQRAATLTAQFEQRKVALERSVEELRTFEREYRTRLKSYLESQLRDLNASGRAEPANSNGEFADARTG